MSGLYKSYLEALQDAHSVERARSRIAAEAAFEVVTDLRGSRQGYALGKVFSELGEINGSNVPLALWGNLSPSNRGQNEWIGSNRYYHSGDLNGIVSDLAVETHIYVSSPNGTAMQHLDSAVLHAVSREQSQIHNGPFRFGEKASFLYSIGESETALRTAKSVRGDYCEYGAKDYITTALDGSEKRICVGAIKVPVDLLRAPFLSGKLIATPDDKIDSSTEVFVMIRVDLSSSSQVCINLVTRGIYEGDALLNREGQEAAQRYSLNAEILKRMGIDLKPTIAKDRLRIAIYGYGWEGKAEFHSSFLTSKGPYADSHVRQSLTAEMALATALTKSSDTVGTMTLTVGAK